MTMLDQEKEVIFTSETIKKCDELAKVYLFVNDKEVKKKTLIPELQSVVYKETGFVGGTLFVCLDGTVLFTPNFMSKRAQIKAFENGLRTDPTMLLERRHCLEDEIFGDPEALED